MQKTANNWKTGDGDVGESHAAPTRCRPRRLAISETATMCHQFWEHLKRDMDREVLSI